MAQYCRYCSHFVTGNGNWCEAKQTEPTDAQAKRTNRCKLFNLNQIDAFGENMSGYRQREKQKKHGEQQKKYGEQVRMDL